MTRIFAVKTDPQTGLAVFGTVRVPAADSFITEPLPRAPKEPGVQAAPHHPPGKPILLTILKGTHNIIVPAANGETEVVLPLRAGDQVLFMDYAPEQAPAPRGEFHYAGHRSIAGYSGAELLPAKVTNEVDIAQLDWRDGLVR